MKLNTVATRTTWNDAAQKINANTQLIGDELERLKSATYKNKGYFASAESLALYYPTATAGARAYVGTSYPYAIYLWNESTQTWEDSGQVGGEEDVDLNDYYTKEESKELLDEYHVVLTQADYDALESKEDKFYFTYEEE